MFFICETYTSHILFQTLNIRISSVQYIGNCTMVLQKFTTKFIGDTVL